MSVSAISAITAKLNIGATTAATAIYTINGGGGGRRGWPRRQAGIMAGPTLDVNRLENARRRGDKLVARCPACAELGSDKGGNHLCVFDGGVGAFTCIAYPGVSGGSHRKRICALVGKDFSQKPRPVPLLYRPTKTVDRVDRIPPLRTLSVAEMALIARQRGWPSYAGLELLGQRGLLHLGEVWDDGRTWPAWVACDRTRRNADARRLDGAIWSGIRAKAKALTSGTRGWPIGAAYIGDRPSVVLCEGMPDFAAALLVAFWEGINVDRIAPVCMTGAANPIHQDALVHFRNKHARIMVHDDAAGRAAAKRWTEQLYRAGARLVDAVNFPGPTGNHRAKVKDLADYAALLRDEESGGPTQQACAAIFAGL